MSRKGRYQICTVSLIASVLIALCVEVHVPLTFQAVGGIQWIEKEMFQVEMSSYSLVESRYLD